MLEPTMLSDREVWLRTIDLGLEKAPGAIPLLFERAKTLDGLGRDEEAEQAYRAVIERQNEHFGAWNDLGMLLTRRGAYEEALDCFQKAVAAEPELAVGHANLAYLMLRGGDHKGASAVYKRALEIDPQNVEAHRGLTIALKSLGQDDEARKHREAGFERSPLSTLTFRGTKNPIPVLLLVSESAANVPLERLIDNRTFLIHKLIVEYADRIETLPEHAIVINAVGDVDASAEALFAARAIVIRSSAPVINHPDIVAETGRIDNALRLSKIEGVRTARVRRISRRILLDPQAKTRLASLDLEFPLLLRSFGYHTGEHFLRVNESIGLNSAVQQLPGSELLAMEFLDLKSPQNTYTKYRMMIVGDSMYPLHAAISHDWKVHYFSAAMSDEPAHREIDADYLNNPVGVIGQKAISCLAEISQTLGLEYGGIDFGIDADGDVVVFEANATMVVARPGNDPMWDYRREAVRNIDNAFHNLLLARCRNLAEVA